MENAVRETEREKSNDLDREKTLLHTTVVVIQGNACRRKLFYRRPVRMPMYILEYIK